MHAQVFCVLVRALQVVVEAECVVICLDENYKPQKLRKDIKDGFNLYQE